MKQSNIFIYIGAFLLALVVGSVFVGCAYVVPSLSCTGEATAADLSDATARCTVSLHGVQRDIVVKTATVGPLRPVGASSQPSR